MAAAVAALGHFLEANRKYSSPAEHPAAAFLLPEAGPYVVVQAGPAEKNLLSYVFPSLFCVQDLGNESVAWDGLAAVEAAAAAAGGGVAGVVAVAGPSDAVEVDPAFERNVH